MPHLFVKHASPTWSPPKFAKRRRGPRTPSGTPPSTPSSERGSAKRRRLMERRTPSSTPTIPSERSLRSRSSSDLELRDSSLNAKENDRIVHSQERAPSRFNETPISSTSVSPFAQQHDFGSRNQTYGTPPRLFECRKSRSRSPSIIFPDLGTNRSPGFHRASFKHQQKSSVYHTLPTSMTCDHHCQIDHTHNGSYERKSRWDTQPRTAIEQSFHSSPFQSQRRRGSPNRVIGVFNIPWDVNEADLYQLYRPYGPIEDVRLIYDHQTGTSRGFAFVSFNHLRDATKAIDATQGMKIDNRTIKADYALGENLGHAVNLESNRRSGKTFSERVSYAHERIHYNHHLKNDRDGAQWSPSRRADRL